MVLRIGRADDAPLIAAIHAASWRVAYRAILDPRWLAQELDADRLATWRQRMDDPAPGQQVLIAERDGAAIGFVCLIARADPRWGGLVDNLHVAPDQKGGGVGSQLLRAAAARMAPDGGGLHLFCYTANHPARGFYDRMGGQVVEALEKPGPDGRPAPELRYFWADAAALAVG